VGDVWELFQTILDQRKRREVDPTVEMLRGCLARHRASHGEDDHALRRMRDLLELLELLVAWYEQMRRLSPTAQRRLLKLGNRLGQIRGGQAGAVEEEA
jgi:DNA-binding transcriptional regulator GbsR (MarR family)